MGNTRNTGYLQNIVKVSDTGNIAFMSGSTILMQISSSGAISSSATTVSSSVDNLVVNNNAVLGSSESSTVSIPAFIASDLYPIADTYKLGSPANYWTTAYVQTGSFNEVNVTGRITAQTLVVQTITSSVDFVTGSTRFGSILSNTHVFSGSVTMNPGGLFVSSSGIVGIGTTTPAYTLDVVSSTSGNLGRFFYTDGTYNPRLQITGDSTGITFYESFSTGANSIKFSIAGSSTLTLKGNNVGIGTTNPTGSATSNLLHVNGTEAVLRVGPHYPGAERDFIELIAQGTDTKVTSPNERFWIENTSGSIVISGTGGVGIGITNPGVSLDISSKTDAVRLPNGTTAQRPTAATGQIRYNTSFNFLEYYDGSNWVPVVGQTSPGSTASNPAESADEIKTYNPNATNGLYWIRQIGTTPTQAYCVFTDYTGAAIAGGPWTVPIISNDANSNFSTNGPAAAATFLSKCQAIGIASPGRGMENTRTTTEVYGAWLAVKRALWNNYAAFIENGDTGGNSVLRMPMININGEGGSSAHRLVYNTSLGTHIPPNESGDACDAGQLFCGWWSSTDTTGWRTNNNTVPGPEDWAPSNSSNPSYNGAGLQSTLTVCVYK